MSTTQVIVEQWPTPSGYANGRIGHGPVLHVAGQVGWEPDGRFVATDLVGQFAKALDNVLAVVHAARGGARDIATMTIYVTDIQAYRDARKAIGAVWRERMMQHFPAMALVGVTALVQPEALVEIQATAHLEHEV
jgi:enamine deaminase RidA (YjgF/YER057c/UK114 family)